MACRTRRPRWAWTTAWPSPRPCSTRDCPWWRRGPSFLRDGCRRWQGRTRCCAACAGRHEGSIGDTIGVAVPTQVGDVVGLLRDAVKADALAVHFHDTRGTALANVLAALQEGIAVVDSSAGGLGGCPYAPGASGNLATEDLLYMLHGMGVATGARLDRVAAAPRAPAPPLGPRLPSRSLQAGSPAPLAG